MKLSKTEQREEDILDLMRRSRVSVGYYAHVHSILSKYPQSRWPEITRSIQQHGASEWFTRTT
jgi:hypothetical protein